MAPPVVPRIAQEPAGSPTRFLEFALGVNPCKLGSTTGTAQRPCERPGPVGAFHPVLEETRKNSAPGTSGTETAPRSEGEEVRSYSDAQGSNARRLLAAVEHPLTEVFQP
jgi:hypothetical protein